MLRLAKLTPAVFRLALVVVLGAAFVLLQLTHDAAQAPANDPAWQNDGRLHVFFHPDCPHCAQAIAFLKTRHEIRFVLHDISTPAGDALLLGFARQHNLPERSLGVPFFVRGARYMLGFDTSEATHRELLALAGDSAAVALSETKAGRITLPLIGSVDPSRYSLLGLTVLMGLSDGFNPCAMWVLIYLISLIAAVQDPRKIWWLVGTFVFASGALYYLFMTAWLNTFLVIGYVRPLTQFVALLAIGFGANQLYVLAEKHGVIVCELGDAAQRRRTMEWARRLVAAPIGLASLTMAVGLAFAVNAIEFVCSAALPAIYTHLLTLNGLSSAQYYGFIGLYVTFFMLDDLIIFGFAIFAVQKIINTRYAAVSHLAGGLILVGLGVWMLAR